MVTGPVPDDQANIAGEIRVVVVDDHEMVRVGLEVLLRAPYRVVASVGTTAEALDAAARYQPHVVLLDVRLADGSGVDAIAALVRAAPGTNVVMLSTYEEPRWARAAIEAGARGYLVKDADQLDLVRGLDRVMLGGVAIDARVAAGVFGADGHNLTAREQEVIELIARGLTNRDIAAELNLSSHTVKEYVSAVLHKLGARTRAEAVSRAGAAGLLSGSREP